MQNFEVRFVLGESTGSDESFNFKGQNGSATYEARSRVHALEQFYKEFSSMAVDEFTVLAEHPSGSPLGFSDEEISEIKELDLSFIPGYPKSGIQIEEINHI